MMRSLIAIAALLASSIISAEQGNYILGPIDDAPIEIAVPEVSEDGRPAGVPAEAKLVRVDIRSITQGDYYKPWKPFQPWMGTQQSVEWKALAGIAAPRYHYNHWEQQPYWEEAAKALQYMVLSGSEDSVHMGRVYVDVIHEGDRLTPTFVQLYHATEGYDINASMVCAGYAWWHRSTWPRKVLSDCEAEARREKRGLWSDPNPIAPWDWRKGDR